MGDASAPAGERAGAVMATCAVRRHGVGCRCGGIILWGILNGARSLLVRYSLALRRRIGHCRSYRSVGSWGALGLWISRGDLDKIEDMADYFCTYRRHVRVAMSDPWPLNFWLADRWLAHAMVDASAPAGECAGAVMSTCAVGRHGVGCRCGGIILGGILNGAWS